MTERDPWVPVDPFRKKIEAVIAPEFQFEFRRGWKGALADHIGCSESQVSDIMDGTKKRMFLSTVDRYLTALEIPLYEVYPELYDGLPAPPPEG
jgi:hypothetical protein